MNESRAPDDAHCRIEDASHETGGSVRWRRLHQTIMEARKGLDSFQTDELQAIIDEAVMASRQAP